MGDKKSKKSSKKSTAINISNGPNSKNQPQVIKKIKENLQERYKFISKILNIKKNYKITFDKVNEEILVSENDKKVISATYDFYGIIKQSGQFYWSYMIPGSNKKFIKKIEEMKNLSYLFENSDDPDMLFYHQILTQDSIFIDDSQLEKLLSFLLYLGGNTYFLHSVNSSGNIQLIFINDITEKFV